MKPTKPLSDHHEDYHDDCNTDCAVDHHHQFLFGYGSLINGYSRAFTSPEQANNVVTPVLVRGLQRVWSVPMTHAIAMGVRLQPKAECVGILMPVSTEELTAFDQREGGLYHRIPLSLEQIDLVPFLNKEEHYAQEEHRIILDAMKSKQRRRQQQDDDDDEAPFEDFATSIHVWVYVPRFHGGPSPTNPIVQSYVDTILQGCLDISEDFAKAFLMSTKGWNPSDLLYVASNYDDDNMMMKSLSELPMEVYWWNDRDDPIYPRGDHAWSRQNADRVDGLLEKYLTDDSFSMRVQKSTKHVVGCVAHRHS